MIDPLPALRSPADLLHRRDFILGRASVRPSTRIVHGPGGRAAVEPRVIQVLLALADANGQVVSRDELFARCWGGVYVGDDSLNRAISEVRRIAREQGAGSFIIDTIPRTGYRLRIVDAARDDLRETATDAENGPYAQILRRTALAGTAVVVAGAVGWRGVGFDRKSQRVEELIQQSELAMRRGIPDGDSSGVGFLTEAVAIQPDNALAWGRLSYALMLKAEYAGPEQRGDSVVAVQDTARRALAINSRQIDALSALAQLAPYYGDWLHAERQMEAVLAIDRQHLPTLDALAFLQVSVGRSRESAIDRVAFASREPLHVTHQYRLAYALWILGNIAKADRVLTRAMQLWPRHPAVWLARVLVLAFTGRVEHAIAHVRNATASPDFPQSMLDTIVASLIAANSGRAADIEEAVDVTLAGLAMGPSMSIVALLMLNLLGQIDKAFDVANAYYLERGPLIARLDWEPGDASVNDHRWRKTHPLFVPACSAMRTDPRFLPMVERMGLVNYWREAGAQPDFLKESRHL